MNKIKKIKIPFKVIFKLFLAFGVATAILLFMVSKIGGQNEQIREGAEDFFSEVTNTRTVINESRYLGLVPDIRVEIDDVIFQEKGDPTHIFMRIGSFDFSLPLLHYVLNRKTIETFRLRDVETEAGFLTPGEVRIKKAQIATREKKPVFEVDGSYAGRPLKGWVSIEARLHKDRTVYKLNEKTPFHLEINGLTLNGTLTSAKKVINLSELQILKADTEIFNGNIVIGMHKDHKTLTGTLVGRADTVKPDLKFQVNDDGVLTVRGGLFEKPGDCSNTESLDMLKDRLGFFLDGIAVDVALTGPGLTDNHPCAKYGTLGKDPTGHSAEKARQ